MGSESQRDEEFERTFDALDADVLQELIGILEEPPEHGQNHDPLVATHVGDSDSEMLHRIERKTFTKLGMSVLPREKTAEVEENRDDGLAARRLRVDRQRCERQGLRTRGSGRRKRVAIGAAVAAVVIGILVASPGPVSAALQKMIQFIPGIGTVQQAQSTTSTVPEGMAVLEKPVHGAWDGSSVTVMGVMVSPTQILVRLNGTDTAPPTKVVFKTANGQTFQLSSYGAASSMGLYGSQWTGDYSLNGNFGQVGSILSGTVLIGTGAPGQIPVHLHVAKSVTELSQLGPTDSHQGIAIALVASGDGQVINLTLAYQYQGPYHIWDFTPIPVNANPNVPAHPGLEVTDSAGKSYLVKQVMTMGPGNQVTFQPDAGQSQFHVTIPQVDATYPGSATVVLPVPTKGSQVVGQTVTLAGFPVTFTKVERTSDNTGKNLLRAYVDVHASLTQPKELHWFELNEGNHGISYSGRLDSSTGAVQYVEFEVKPGQRWVRLTLTEPQVYIRGPWTFDVHVPAAAPVGPTSRNQTGNTANLTGNQAGPSRSASNQSN